MRLAKPAGVAAPRKPMRATFEADCCARAPSGAANAAMPRPGMPGAPSFDHPVRAQQQLLRNGEPQRLRRFQVYAQIELRRLFDGKIAGPRSLQDSIHVVGGAAKEDL